MNELKEVCPEGKLDIRVVYLHMDIILGLLGFLVDFPVITVIAILKSPFMLFKGWHHLFQDCVGREGPFLETICVPFAGLPIFAMAIGCCWSRVRLHGLWYCPQFICSRDRLSGHIVLLIDDLFI
ncbi:hypothetical protein M8C21_004250 [Ambrosia artemisiifolia]|uniref:Uncharacterized protein n=1 Tax=Ambrosia artemisiifolia TaxID=4212 RepID=A0AAD5C2L6_AMBAR|nr:hypothetical protein M8C21_004250 [Ambrosia artemisiifolia]